MIKALALLSGGLDSMLAVKVIQEQNIDVVGICFVSPFFDSKKGEKAAKELDIELRIIDITQELVDILKNPKYGFGKNINPCIDCHGLMLRKTGQIMKDENFDFIITGEVLGQRPMSQNKQSLHIVQKLSTYDDYIVRPLSAKLLPETELIKKGIVKMEGLLDISGRSRKRQIELAKKYKFKNIPAPAGGCNLTDQNYTHRFKSLFDFNEIENNKEFVENRLPLLNIGRHFKIENFWIIVGRNEKENNLLEELMIKDKDVKIELKDYVCPVVLIPLGVGRCASGAKLKELIYMAGTICARYSNQAPDEELIVLVQENRKKYEIKVRACKDREIRKRLL